MFHNSPNGPQPCRAKSHDACPYGRAGAEHFATKEAAQGAYEVSMSQTFGAVTSLKRKVGGLRVAKLNHADEKILQAQNRVRKPKKKMGSVALVMASIALFSACSTNTGYVPEYTEEELTQQNHAVQDDKANEKSYKDYIKDAKDRMTESAKKLEGEVESTYGRDWKEKLSGEFEQYGDYLQDQYDEHSQPSDGGMNTAESKYDRDAFKHWTDTSLYANSCDARQDVLQRDLTNIVYDTDGCTVLKGTLQDPYTGTSIYYERGNNSVDIDHIVALEDAWLSGAWQWSDAQREAFANDPANLIAVQSSANRSKGSRSPGKWLPINRDYACEYGRNYLKLVKDYELTMKPADVAATNEACS